MLGKNVLLANTLIPKEMFRAIIVSTQRAFTSLKIEDSAICFIRVSLFYFFYFLLDLRDFSRTIFPLLRFWPWYCICRNKQLIMTRISPILLCLEWKLHLIPFIVCIYRTQQGTWFLHSPFCIKVGRRHSLSKRQKCRQQPQQTRMQQKVH